jgi:hypothetical protein
MTPQQSDAEVKSDDKALPSVTSGQPHLSRQDLSTLDITKLTPLSPEVISRQATINIGTIGHVAHGKSTVVKALSGVHTVRFKNELERNITIKLGYANAKVNNCSFITSLALKSLHFYSETFKLNFFFVIVNCQSDKAKLSRISQFLVLLSNGCLA